MANAEHLDILDAGVEVWNQWRMQASAIRPDLSGADLRQRQLRAIDLSGVDLSESDLSGADFAGAAGGLLHPTLSCARSGS